MKPQSSVLSPRNSRPGEARPRQSVAVEIRNDLLGVIRNQFYGDLEPKTFFKDQTFLLNNVILWPASWLDKRGVTLPPARYKAILLEVLNGIKQHGDTGSIKYWPGYLMKCVQSHFQIHGDEYYDEAKALRTTLAGVIKKAEKVPVADPIRAMAEARRDLLQAGRKTRQKAPKPVQQTLLQLGCIALASGLLFGSNLCVTALSGPSSVKPPKIGADSCKPLQNALLRADPL
ncbi:MAG TPA: hypothetical protein VM680_18390 [Verrucomicrobiae bacterium]|nr:hypothetical protein [Verrucomicrobiae bacterium]